MKGKKIIVRGHPKLCQNLLCGVEDRHRPGGWSHAETGSSRKDP